MSDFSTIFSGLIFKKCGLVREHSDLDFKFSEDIGNLNNCLPNKIYKDLTESYVLIEENNSKFPIKYRFTDPEIEFQKKISNNGTLKIIVETTYECEQIWSIEICIPTNLNDPSSQRKILTVRRTQEMIKPYSVIYETDYEESLSVENFEKLALAYSLKY